MAVELPPGVNFVEFKFGPRGQDFGSRVSTYEQLEVRVAAVVSSFGHEIDFKSVKPPSMEPVIRAMVAAQTAPEAV